MDKNWIVTLEEDPESGDLILPFPEDLLKEAGWAEGDVITWQDNGDGSWTLIKCDPDTSMTAAAPMVNE